MRLGLNVFSPQSFLQCGLLEPRLGQGSVWICKWHQRQTEAMFSKRINSYLVLTIKYTKREPYKRRFVSQALPNRLRNKTTLEFKIPGWTTSSVTENQYRCFAQNIYRPKLSFTICFQPRCYLTIGIMKSCRMPRVKSQVIICSLLTHFQHPSLICPRRHSNTYTY